MKTKKFTIWIDQMRTVVIDTHLGQNLKQLMKNPILFLKMEALLTKEVQEIIGILLKMQM